MPFPLLAERSLAGPLLGQRIGPMQRLMLASSYGAAWWAALLDRRVEAPEGDRWRAVPATQHRTSEIKTITQTAKLKKQKKRVGFQVVDNIFDRNFEGTPRPYAAREGKPSKKGNDRS